MPLRHDTYLSVYVPEPPGPTSSPMTTVGVIHVPPAFVRISSACVESAAASMVARLDGIEPSLPALLTEACRKANVFDGRDHLLDSDFVGFIAYHCLLLGKARLRLFHTGQPFQGLLDQERSGGSAHALHVQDDLLDSSGRLLRERDDLEGVWGAQELKCHLVAGADPLQ